MKCNHCNQEMLTAESCSKKHVNIDGTVFARDTSYFDHNERCHDCGIINAPGNVHHMGCDVERCPVCHGQFISCDCNGIID